MQDFLDSQGLLQSAPTVMSRIQMMREAAATVLIGSAASGPLSPLLRPLESPQRVLEFPPRRVIVDIPERGQDGAYIITVEGEPEPMLRAGIDRYAHQYRFHRITEPTQPLKFTIEWQGGDGLNDALHLVYFCQLLQQLIASMRLFSQPAA